MINLVLRNFKKKMSKIILLEKRMYALGTHAPPLFWKRRYAANPISRKMYRQAKGYAPAIAGI
jgi:hypothetical protein